MTMETITKSAAKAAAKQYAVPLNELINPSDADADAHTWDEVNDEQLTHEINQSVDIIMSELAWHDRLQALMYKRAVTLHIDAMPRVPFDKLTFDSREAAVKAGFWPYDVDKWTAIDITMQTHDSLDSFPSDVVSEAREPIVSGLTEGMHPQSDI